MEDNQTLNTLSDTEEENKNYTKNLNLFKYNTEKDGKEVFSLEKALNENWNKIDEQFPPNIRFFDVPKDSLGNVYAKVLVRDRKAQVSEPGYYRQFTFKSEDTNETQMQIQYRHNPQGQISLAINGCKDDNTSYNGIYFGVNADNTWYTQAPSCSNANSILTTVSISKAASGYVKLGNGLIIQWGLSASVNNNTQFTQKFPVSFSNTNYIILCNPHKNNHWCTIQSRAVGSCVLYYSDYGNKVAGQISWLAFGY